MKRCHLAILVAGICMMSVVAVQADWNPGDPYKMHHPQLPDPNGWDVAFTGNTLADDFQCSESGEITAVHFWVSWKDDAEDWNSITNIHLSFHSDNPQGPEGWSQPDQLLWEGDFDPGQFVYRTYGDPSPQGWFDPLTGQYEEDNHNGTWQINITGIQNPFYQIKDEIYWLDIEIDQGDNPQGAEIGWKTTTSQDAWNDDSVYFDEQEPNSWRELIDPVSQDSLDQAFVVVPEPSVIAMVVAIGGGLVFVRRIFMI